MCIITEVSHLWCELYMYVPDKINLPDKWGNGQHCMLGIKMRKCQAVTETHGLNNI